LRTLSSLGVVRIASGSEVLLPSDVPGHMEQQGTQPDNTLRRSVFGPRVKPDQIIAANKYIGEREKTKLKIFDIKKHSLYNGQNGDFYYGGTRNVDGHVLALLKYGDEVVVLPIDQATTRRLKRVGVGDPVTITATGSIKTSKGRSQ